MEGLRPHPGRLVRCRDIDPVEDTESRTGYLLAARSQGCRDIDPVEDTESVSLTATCRIMDIAVAGISIRLRILKGACQTPPVVAAISCRDIDPVEDTESTEVAHVVRHCDAVAGISIRLRILKDQGDPLLARP